MSIAAAQADAFVAEVLVGNKVWTIRDSGGFPTSTNGSGETAMPFWSKRIRAQRIVDQRPAYRAFEPFELSLAEFLQSWLPGLERDGLLAGLNWSGAKAIGYDLTAAELRARLEAASSTRNGH